MGLSAMSNAVRHSFHTESDPDGFGTLASALDPPPGEVPERPTPILIARADAVRAFDLFQPEPGEFAAFDSPPMPPAVVPIADGQFARQVARALDAPPPANQPLHLPLGGVAPTEREIAAARALIVGWIAACAIAAFAFLAQGPTITARPEETAASQPPVAAAAPGSQPGDIRLDPAAAAKPAPARAKKTAREPAPSPAGAKP